MMQTSSPTPVQQIISPETCEAGIQLYIKRDDLVHPLVSGNKWRKLKHNLQEARNLNKDTLLTFGGAFSNHIYSTAAAAAMHGFRSVGIIRGEETLPLNPTLSFARDAGMQIHYMDRSRYREKDSPELIRQFREQFGDFYLIPEGGSGPLAVKGVSELVAEISFPFDYICTPVGTGGTMAGLIAGVPPAAQVLGFAALRAENYLEEEVRNLLSQNNSRDLPDWHICHDYHFGGYARIDKKLASFIASFESSFAIPLDPVYTSKMFFGLLDLISKGYFEKGKTIIALHTGGLQGKAGMQPKIEKLLAGSA